MIPENRIPTHPGEVLVEEFLKPLKVSQVAFARHIGVPVQRVNEIGDYMRKEYQKLGFNTGDSQTPIIPIIIGDQDATFFIWKVLFEEGIYTNPVIPPGVAPNLSLLRTSYMATHTDEQMELVLEKFAKIGRSTGLIS